MRVDPPRRFPVDPRRRLQVGQPRLLHAPRASRNGSAAPACAPRRRPAPRPARSSPAPCCRPARCVVMAKRCASSRTRCRKYSTGSRGGSWNGSRPSDVEPLAPGVAVRPLGDRHHRDLVHAEVLQHAAHRRQLPGAAVDQQQVRASRRGPSRALAACSRSARPNRRSSTSRIIAKSSPGAIGPRIANLR